jgi:integrase
LTLRRKTPTLSTRKTIKGDDMKQAHAITDMTKIKGIVDTAKKANATIYFFIKLALNTGLRVSDILNLTWKNIDLKNRTISLQEQKTGKKKVIDINDTLYVTLSGMDKMKRFLLQSTRSEKPVTRQYIDRELKKIGEKFNVTLSGHALRKSFARTAYENGISIATLMNVLNHSCQRETLIYIDVNANDVKKCYDVVSF